MKLLQRLRETFQQPGAAAAPTRANCVRHATAVLLVEAMRADFDVKDEERAALVGLLERHFGLTHAASRELVDEAEAAADAAVSLYEFTRVLNDSLAPGEKLDVVELLWRACLADGHLDAYEDHLVRKLAELLYVPRGDLVRLRLKVQEG